MAHHDRNTSTDDAAHEHDEWVDKVWKTVEDIRFCLIGSWDGERQRMRPLTAMPNREAGCIRFLVSAAHSADWGIERFPNVTLGFADPGKEDYVAVFGHAHLDNDRARIRELWTPFAKAWWDSPDDPDIRVLTVDAEEAEIWKGPNRLVAGAIMLAAAVAGTKPPIGEHGSVTLGGTS